MKIKHFSLFSIYGFLLFIMSFPLHAMKTVSEKANYPLPLELEGTRFPRLLLNGTWQFKYTSHDRWNTIEVPGEAAMQGYAIEHDRPFTYQKSFTIPNDYTGKRIILRFDGVYSHAQLWVNNTFVREHHGGFTSWDTDITSLVKIGKKNTIRLEVVDRLDEISYASGYAHHPIGGILRDVTLFALPETYIYDMEIETELDSLYQDAVLSFSCKSAGNKEKTELLLNLTAPDGQQMELPHNLVPLSVGEKQTWQFSIKNPLKWDAEHPHLYALTASVYQNGVKIGTFRQHIGFRKIEISGNRMLVNGVPIKLRGACRHDIHPTLGRTTTAELDSIDVLLFKQANMNFVRTSHYPPSRKFVEYCDRYGIYVECETGVCFVDTYRQKNYAPGNTQNNPDYADRYLNQCQEMVKSFRSHPSVLIWSIGNESVYGSNFQQCWDWIKSTDRTRPIIFSYPGSVNKKEKIYDILSMHYQDVNGNVDQWGMSTRHFQGYGIPVLFDEWAHPACYTYTTLQTDPNIREFWGKSIDLMWSGLFDAPGGLGGAIWGYVDETFMLPKPKIGTSFWKEFARTAKPENYQGNCVGYGEWGIVDVWRRQKPEFWSTKKAYSPIRLPIEKISNFTSGQRLTLPIYNRFDHTVLNEISACYTYKKKKKNIVLTSIPPHQKGYITLPADNWEEHETILIEFFTSDGKLIDAYQLYLGSENIAYPPKSNGTTLSVEENNEFIVVRGENFEIPFCQKDGLIHHAKAGKEVLIEKGPFLNLHINLNHLSGAEIRKMADHFKISDTDWKKETLNYQKYPDAVYVNLSGTYQHVKVDFQIKISPNGQIDIDYLTNGVPNGYLRETGLSFHLANTIQQLEWKRNGYWNYYPEGAFAGNEGRTQLYSPLQAAYGEAPTGNWQNDTHNYFYWADAGSDCQHPLTQTAKGMKENIYYYTLQTVKKHQISVLSTDASVACRINKLPTEQLILYTNNRWDYPEIAWGNYCKVEEALPCFGKICITLK